MKAPITFAIAGFGDRGSTYASMQRLFPDRMKVVAVADLDPRKVEKARQLYAIPRENCFSSAEEMLEQPRLADVMVVSTMDRQHVGHAIPALKKGYYILMEKPISPELAKCKEILEVSKNCPGKVIVCHVLRYTVFYNTLKDLIASGRIGDVVSICANENVGYWHQAHSFVRGNWRNSQETSPMILQKSCHDMDILTWLLGKRCKSVSSIGGTTLFKPSMAPEGAALRCLDGCKAKDACPFDAEKMLRHQPQNRPGQGGQLDHLGAQRGEHPGKHLSGFAGRPLWPVCVPLRQRCGRSPADQPAHGGRQHGQLHHVRLHRGLLPHLQGHGYQG